MNVSGSAGLDAAENPRIGEAGRAFLATQLKRLSPEHIRAIFEGAHLEQMHENWEWTDKSTDKSYTGIDAWVAAFQDKVKQIDERHCGA